MFGFRYRHGQMPGRPLQVLCACAVLLCAENAAAIGVAAGTEIQNQASVSFDVNGTTVTLDSNMTTITVVEQIDVAVTLQSPQQLVTAGETGRALLFRLTNTGNGTEAFSLAIDSALASDDFDPVPAVPSIYFDSDGSGDFTPADTAYDPGNNEPLLAADASIDLFIVNDIPAAASNAQIGRSSLIVTSVTGTGAPGTVFAGQGDGGIDAVIGSSSGAGNDAGEYLVSDVQVGVTKTQQVTDPFGSDEPVPGATITYTIAVEVLGAGIATASTLRDAIPTYSTYTPGSILLNAAPLSDAADADAGELDTSGPPTVVVRLGDLTAADGVQTIEFEVTID